MSTVPAYNEINLHQLTVNGNKIALKLTTTWPLSKHIQTAGSVWLFCLSCVGLLLKLIVPMLFSLGVNKNVFFRLWILVQKCVLKHEGASCGCWQIVRPGYLYNPKALHGFRKY